MKYLLSLGLVLSLCCSPLPVVADWTLHGGAVNTDRQGWAHNPRLTTDTNGTLYAAWTQERNPAVNEQSGIYVSKWDGNTWTQLGGRIGHLPPISYPNAYSPSIAMLGSMPCVAWYEGGGYGWSSTPSGQEPAVFVSCWNGSQWAYLANSATLSGQLNTDVLRDARNPVLANIGGTLYCAFVEYRPANGRYNVVIVKHWDGITWVQDGTEFSAGATGTAWVIDLALVDVSGFPYVAWSEWRRSGSTTLTNNPGVVRMKRLDSGVWQDAGGALNAANANPNYLALAAHNGVPYVAYQEKSGAGNYQIFVKHWNGNSWIADGSAQNVTATGEAGRPTLTSDGATVWLAWAEGEPGVKAGLYVRGLTAGSWGMPEGPLNAYPTDGAAAQPALTVTAGVPTVVWSEKHFPTATRQVFVKGRANTGTGTAPPLTQYGADGAPIAPIVGQWVSVTPGGIRLGTNVSDEGFNSFVYDPVTKKALIFARYHSPVANEEQNALVGFDYNRNRWDIIEIGEDAWNEHLPGHGHDAGTVTIDVNRGVYLTRGNLTLNSNTAWQTYEYDLRAGRGKRMLPAQEPGLQGSLASCFDNEHNLWLMLGSNGGGTPHAYTYATSSTATNTWIAALNGPSGRTSPGCVYDLVAHVFVVFGGNVAGVASNQTWVFEPITRVWTQRTPSVSPPGTFSPYMAFDSTRGLTWLVRKQDATLWTYHVGTDVWASMGSLPSTVTSYPTGSYLAYNSDADVLMLYRSSGLTPILIYQPSGGGSASVDLAVTNSDLPDPVTVNQPLTYTVTVTNNGPGAATGVIMTDTLLSGVIFISATPSQGTCSGTSSISCSLGMLTSGTSATVTITVRPSAPGGVSNTATVSATEADPNTANNSATASTTINPNSDSDGDGYSVTDGDCNDSNANIHPGATELCNGVDDNCDNQIDEIFPDLGTSCTAGIGACQRSGTMVCAASVTATECNATPGTPTVEICGDGIDQDCNGADVACPVDNDGDGYSVAAGDCNDSNASIHPGAAELCNSVDDNCDNQVDEIFPDLGTSCTTGVGACQRNGTTVCTTSMTATTCNATPGTPTIEICGDGIDQDCNGADAICQPPSLTVLAPNGGEIWPISSTQTIQWNASGFSGNVNIELSRDGGVSWTSLFSNSANDGTQSWQATSPATGQALVRISSASNPTIRDTSNGVFTLGGGSITVVSPNGGETWQHNSIQTIRWTSSGINGNVEIELSRNGGATWNPLISNTANDGVESWKVKRPATNQARIRVRSLLDATAVDISNGAFTIQ